MFKSNIVKQQDSDALFLLEQLEDAAEKGIAKFESRYFEVDDECFYNEKLIAENTFLFLKEAEEQGIYIDPELQLKREAFYRQFPNLACKSPFGRMTINVEKEIAELGYIPPFFKKPFVDDRYVDLRNPYNYMSVTQSNALIRAEQNLSITQKRLLNLAIASISIKDSALKNKESDDQVPSPEEVKEFLSEFKVKIPLLVYTSMYGLKQAESSLKSLTRAAAYFNHRKNQVRFENSTSFVEIVQSVKIIKNEGVIEVQFHPNAYFHLFDLKENFTQYNLFLTSEFQSFYTLRFWELMQLNKHTKFYVSSFERFLNTMGLQGQPFSRIKQTFYNLFEKEVVGLGVNISFFALDKSGFRKGKNAYFKAAITKTNDELVEQACLTQENYALYVQGDSRDFFLNENEIIKEQAKDILAKVRELQEICHKTGETFTFDHLDIKGTSEEEIARALLKESLKYEEVSLDVEFNFNNSSCLKNAVDFANARRLKRKCETFDDSLTGSKIIAKTGFVPSSVISQVVKLMPKSLREQTNFQQEKTAVDVLALSETYLKRSENKSVQATANVSEKLYEDSLVEEQIAKDNVVDNEEMNKWMSKLATAKENVLETIAENTLRQVSKLEELEEQNHLLSDESFTSKTLTELDKQISKQCFVSSNVADFPCSEEEAQEDIKAKELLIKGKRRGKKAHDGKLRVLTFKEQALFKEMELSRIRDVEKSMLSKARDLLKDSNPEDGDNVFEFISLLTNVESKEFKTFDKFYFNPNVFKSSLTETLTATFFKHCEMKLSLLNPKNFENSSDDEMFIAVNKVKETSMREGKNEAVIEMEYAVNTALVTARQENAIFYAYNLELFNRTIAPFLSEEDAKLCQSKIRNAITVNLLERAQEKLSHLHKQIVNNFGKVLEAAEKLPQDKFDAKVAELKAKLRKEKYEKAKLALEKSKENSALGDGSQKELAGKGKVQSKKMIYNKYMSSKEKQEIFLARRKAMEAERALFQMRI